MRWANIRVCSANDTERGATTIRERMPTPRSMASIPTSSGETPVNGPLLKNRRAFADLVPKPRLTMSVSSSPK
jgi:hypothetical protein